MNEKKIERESNLRSILKAITWRLLGTSTTMIVAFLFTGKASLAAAIGGIEVVAKIFLYYFHERLWQVLPRGTVRKFYNLPSCCAKKISRDKEHSCAKQAHAE